MRTDRPGYQRRKNRDGTISHYWNPKRAVKAAPVFLTIVRLPDNLTDDEIVEECQRRTDELRHDISDKGMQPVFDGTIKSLIDRYRWDKTSTLHHVKHSTRIRDYEPSLRVLASTVGGRRIDVLTASDFRRWYSEWRKKGHRRASGAMKLLRCVLTYGAGERLPGARAAREILADMRFEQPPARNVAMSYDQCRAIVLASAEMEWPSIGFVEALKFETALRRIDVIGEWVPDDGGPFRWQGLSVGQIRGGVLTITTSKTGVTLSRDLSVLPLVQLALESYQIPEIGPVVIDEDTGLPYRDNHYTVKYRKVREAAKVPADIWSMDSRAGAVTETVAATGSLEDGRHLATHTTTKTTSRYNRGDGLEMSRAIAAARTEKRK